MTTTNRLSWLNWALLVALVAVVGAQLALQPDSSHRRPDSPLSNMASSPAFGSFEDNPVFTDGKTLQAPPEGTVPVDAFDPGGLPEDDAAVAAAAARGQAVFRVYCAVCHGPAGAGDGVVTRRGVPAPQSLTGPQAAALTDHEIVRIIAEGRQTMPAYAKEVSPAQRWDLVAYIRSVQTSEQERQP